MCDSPNGCSPCSLSDQLRAQVVPRPGQLALLHALGCLAAIGVLKAFVIAKHRVHCDCFACRRQTCKAMQKAVLGHM